MKPQEAHAALSELLKSTGWQYLKQVLEAKMIEAAKVIATNRAMTAQDIDFQRGAIWAAERLLAAPAQLLNQLEAEVAIAKAMADDKSRPRD